MVLFGARTAFNQPALILIGSGCARSPDPAAAGRSRAASGDRGPNGKAIVYRKGRALFTVDIRITGETVDASEPRMLFQHDGLFTTWDIWGNGWDIGRDGRLLVWQEPAQSPAAHLDVITNLGKLASERVGAAPGK